MTAALDIKDILDESFNASSLPPDVERELLYLHKKDRTVGWWEGRAQLHNVSSFDGVCLRVIAGGGEGLITTTKLGDQNLSPLFQKALQIATVSPQDPSRHLAKPAAFYPTSQPIDDHILTTPPDELRERLRMVEKYVLSIDSRIKKVIKLQYFEGLESKWIKNSWGVDRSYDSSSSGFSIEVLAEQDGESEVAWDYQQKRFARDLKMEEIAVAVARYAVGSLGGKPLTSGFYPVVLHPRVGTQFLDVLSSALSAEAVQLGRSYLKGCLGQHVANELVTLIDDPFLSTGVSSAPLDDEGTPHQVLPVVTKGILNGYFYDLRSAFKAGVASNGHGLKESLGSAPKPAPTNFYCAAGKTPLTELLASHTNVFYIHDVMGLHMVDRITGEFSLGASGAFYEKGQMVRAVRGVTIAGTMVEMLKNIQAVGDDLTWYGDIGAPSILLSKCTVAGI